MPATSRLLTAVPALLVAHHATQTHLSANLFASAQPSGGGGGPPGGGGGPMCMPFGFMNNMGPEGGMMGMDGGDNCNDGADEFMTPKPMVRLKKTCV